MQLVFLTEIELHSYLCIRFRYILNIYMTQSPTLCTGKRKVSEISAQSCQPGNREAVQPQQATD